MELQLKTIRKLAGIKSGREMAERLGVPVSTYACWEAGLRSMPLDKAIDAAGILECTLDELAGRRPVDEVRYYYVGLTDEDRAKVDEYADLLRRRDA